MTTITPHTPGDWKRTPIGDPLDGESLIYTGESPDDINGARIAQVAGGLGFNGERCFESEANARLIAAAPHLLAACRACLTHVKYSDIWDADGKHPEWLKEMKAAITKATE